MKIGLLIFLGMAINLNGMDDERKLTDAAVATGADGSAAVATVVVPRLRLGLLVDTGTGTNPGASCPMARVRRMSETADTEGRWLGAEGKLVASSRSARGTLPTASSPLAGGGTGRPRTADDASKK